MVSIAAASSDAASKTGIQALADFVKSVSGPCIGDDGGCRTASGCCKPIRFGDAHRIGAFGQKLTLFIVMPTPFECLLAGEHQPIVQHGRA
ncbi:hypothetical protein [Paraburkholderia sp. PGU19]|uniref:hypothetical protein n=1 Tax=Paraburkholderia sp. PGU19 TaxID=2735434 RepID=UPI0015D9F44A|nr:hypothetical protein [Paraburkholderia sp. PGU19]